VSKSVSTIAITLIATAALTIAAGCSTAAAPPVSGGSSSGSTTSAQPATPDPKADWPKEFIVGYFGGDDPSAQLEKQEAWRAHLEKELGIPVKAITGTSYTAVIEAMAAKKADAMEVGPFSYILAVQEAKAEALVATVSATDQKKPKYDPAQLPYYYSVIITKKGSGVRTIADLKGKGFSFVDPASTSGHLMPKTYLVKMGLDPDKDMTTVFAGSHPTSVIAVANGKTPAGATYEGNLNLMIAQEQADVFWYPDGQFNKKRTEEELLKIYDQATDGKIVIIGQTDPIPNTPFAVRSDLPASFKAAVKAALMSDPANAERLSTSKKWYVDPSKELGLSTLDQFYNPLRDVAKLLNLDLKELGG